MAKKKPKGPPNKRSKTVASVQAPGPIVTSEPNEKPKEKKKKKKRQRQPGALGSAVPGAPELASAALPIPAPTTDVIVDNFEPHHGFDTSPSKAEDPQDG
jgi:hypothetical protein